jgi:hypothetical protein
LVRHDEGSEVRNLGSTTLKVSTLTNTPLMWFKTHEEVKKISKDTIRLQKKATTLQTKGMRKQMKKCLNNMNWYNYW